MIAKKTLFVLGAGASAEVNMPVGDALRKNIAQSFEFELENPLAVSSANKYVVQAIRSKCQSNELEMAEMAEQATRLRDALSVSKSIDDTLNIWQNHPAAVYCGKAAIVGSILQAEGKSKLRMTNDGRADLELSRDTWYYKVFSEITNGAVSHEMILENIAFIDFNYDRCVPWYLINAIRSLYPDCKNPKEFVSEHLKIAHPYGSLGDLSDETSPVFGDASEAKTASVLTKILTYSEQVSDEGLVSRMGGMLREAERIVFLGFAFHQQNIDLLAHAAAGELTKVERAYATVVSMPTAEVKFKSDATSKALGLKNLNTNPNAAHAMLTQSAYEIWHDV